MNYFLKNISKKVAQFFLVIFILFLGVSVEAATITVDDGTSTVATDTACSIREAIENANDNATTNVDCTAGSGTDTIDITVDISLDVIDHDYMALPAPTEAIILQGNNHSITRIGVTDMDLLDEPEDITIQELSISGFSRNSGNTGSGLIECINSNCRIVLTDVEFINNTDGVIDSDISTGAGEWIFTNVTLLNNSSTTGGIMHSGFARNITITNLTATGNSSSSGIDGGILTYTGAGSGIIEISDSLFSDNSTHGFGAALGVSLYGGVTTVNINNTTFESETSDNSGGDLSIEGNNVSLNIDSSLFNGGIANSNGGAIYIQDTVSTTITNSTFYNNTAITGNGGAIYVGDGGLTTGSFHASHNTFYNNSAGSNLGADLFHTPNDADVSEFENNIFSGTSDDCAGDFTNISFTNNLSGDSDCGPIATGSGIDSSLVDNGGSTKTLALLAISNAVNTGVSGILGCPATDARGTARPSGVACDIGSFEFVNTTPADISLSDLYVPEKESVGTPVGTLTATDADLTDTHTYSLSCAVAGVDDSSFSISVDELLSAESFDYETKSSYSVCIRVTDISNATYDENFTITVTEEESSSSGSSSGPSAPTNPTPPVDPVIPTPLVPIVPVPPVVPIEENPPQPPLPETPAPSPEDIDSPDEPEDNTPTTQPIYNNGEENVSGESVFTAVGNVLGVVIDELPKSAADAVAVVGVALPVIVLAISQPAVAVNVVSIPMRLFNLIPVWLGLRRKKRPWGTVYDSVTKQPLDPVYVVLKDLRGREVATTITDIDGRFGFLVPPGRYNISVRKDNYDFPSKKLLSNTKDELYGNLYFGEEIEILGEDDLLIKNIPMDSTNFNWNEFEKSQNKSLMKFYSQSELFIARFASVLFWGGLIVSIALLFGSPTTLNYVLFGVYALALVLRGLGIKPKKPGYVVERATGFPLSFGVIKVYSESTNTEIAHTVISKTGKYYVLVPKGRYYLSILKKVGEDEYAPVFKSEAMSVKKGYIGDRVKV